MSVEDNVEEEEEEEDDDMNGVSPFRLSILAKRVLTAIGLVEEEEVKAIELREEVKGDDVVDVSVCVRVNEEALAVEYADRESSPLR